MKKIFRFIRALLRYAIYGHFKKTDFETYARRLSACVHCAYKNEKNWTCNICGCYLVKKAKWSTECCPKEKW